MSTAIFAYSRQGCQTARRIAGVLDGAPILYTAQRLSGGEFLPIPTPSQDFFGSIFSRSDAMIFVCSCGIALRHIAPHLRGKDQDPAVIVVDELGKFVIPILSGHIGGANALAQALAGALDATAVITTATDINRRFSVDAWAAEHNCAISSLKQAKSVSAAILEGDVPMVSDFPIATALPPGVSLGSAGQVGFCISYRTCEPFANTLRLIPRILHLGIGCRRGTSAEQIRTAVLRVLENSGIDLRAVKCAASIDLKADEPGLAEFCAEYGLPLSFYTAQQLKQIPGDFTPSEFVSGITGVDNVCERAACVGADRLIVRKTASDGVTVALASEHWEVHFG